MLLNCGVEVDSWGFLGLQDQHSQSWIFIGRMDAEAETPVLWLPDEKNWLIWKDPDAGRDWRQEEKGTTEDEMVGWHHQLSGHTFESTPGVGDEQGGLHSMGSQRVRHDWATELNWGIISNLAIIESTQEGVCRLYANARPFYVRDLSIHSFCYPWGSWNQSSERWLYCSLFNHSPVARHLGYFQFGAITNKGAMNIHCQAFV